LISKLVVEAIKRKSVGEPLADGIGKLIDLSVKKGFTEVKNLLVSETEFMPILLDPENWQQYKTKWMPR
jgi:hypothetical protein